MKIGTKLPSNPIPTNGHPTRKAAIIELYEARVQQKEIAKRLDCSRNAVSQTIFDYRQKAGRYIDPITTPPARRRKAQVDIKHGPDGYRWLNYRKSVEGARSALREYANE